MNNNIIPFGDATLPNYYPDNNTVDLCLCDPPFKPKSKQYKQIRDETSHKLDPIPTPSNPDYNLWWLRVLRNIKDSLKKGGYFIFKSDDYTSRELYEITKTFFDYRGSIVWDKKVIGLGRTVRKRHELLEIYVKKGETPYWGQERLPSRKILVKSLDGEYKEIKVDKWHGDIVKRVALSSVVQIIPDRAGMLGVLDDPKHINQTPITLWKKIIPYFCPTSGLILDPFAGTGSIGKAIKDLNKLSKYNLFYYGFDIMGVRE